MLLVQSSRECTPPYLSTGLSNLLQPAQAEVELGQLSTYLASGVRPVARVIELTPVIKHEILLYYFGDCLRRRHAVLLVSLFISQAVYSLICSLHLLTPILRGSTSGAYVISCTKGLISSRSGMYFFENTPLPLPTPPPHPRRH